MDIDTIYTAAYQLDLSNPYSVMAILNTGERVIVAKDLSSNQLVFCTFICHSDNPVLIRLQDFEILNEEESTKEIEELKKQMINQILSETEVTKNE